MMRNPLTVAAILLSVFTPLASAAEPEVDATPVATPDSDVQLDDDDRQLITMEILKGHPLLSASPGIKFAYAYGGYDSIGDEIAPKPSIVMANVIFYPHAESRGVKQAYEAHCQRRASNKEWSCPSVEIRRYVKFDFQEFEVRVKGNLDLAGIQAVIEATRQPAALAGLKYSEVADTAHVIFACGDGFVVSWGNKEGSGGLGLEARLRAGGNPADANDWDVNALPVL